MPAMDAFARCGAGAAVGAAVDVAAAMEEAVELDRVVVERVVEELIEVIDVEDVVGCEVVGLMVGIEVNGGIEVICGLVDGRIEVSKVVGRDEGLDVGSPDVDVSGRSVLAGRNIILVKSWYSEANDETTSLGNAESNTERAFGSPVGSGACVVATWPSTERNQPTPSLLIVFPTGTEVG